MINTEICGASYIELAAVEWYRVRKIVCSKETPDIKDLINLCKAEAALMEAIKQSDIDETQR